MFILSISAPNLDISRTVGRKELILTSKTLNFFVNIIRVKFCNMTPKGWWMQKSVWNYLASLKMALGQRMGYL